MFFYIFLEGVFMDVLRNKNWPGMVAMIVGACFSFCNYATLATKPLSKICGANAAFEILIFVISILFLSLGVILKPIKE